MSLTEKAKSRVLELGADFVGVAPVSRFDGAPHLSDPRRLLPGACSVIAFGIAMDRGALEAWFSKADRRPLVLQTQLATDEINRISLYLSRWLERQGHRSVYVAQNGRYNVYRGRPDFSHKHAAMAAGLGRLGSSSCLVHTRFGAAVHLASVITEAELDADAMICDDDDPCNRCNSCITICPAQAISQDRQKTFIMEGQEYSHQWVNRLRCGWACGGLSGHEYRIGKHTVGTWAYNDLPIPTDLAGFPDKYIEADRFLRHPMELAEMVITGGTQYCGNCNKVCIGTRKDTAALLKLHTQSGVAAIPEDPAVLLNLKSANAKLEKYRIPADEVEALVRT